MAWLTALIKAILDWVTGEIKKDTKAGDADDVPEELKDKWRERIRDQEKKVKKNPNLRWDGSEAPKEKKDKK